MKKVNGLQQFYLKSTLSKIMPAWSVDKPELQWPSFCRRAVFCRNVVQFHMKLKIYNWNLKFIKTTVRQRMFIVYRLYVHVFLRGLSLFKMVEKCSRRFMFSPSPWKTVKPIKKIDYSDRPDRHLGYSCDCWIHRNWQRLYTANFT